MAWRREFRLVLSGLAILALGAAAGGEEPTELQMRQTGLVKMLQEAVPATVLLHTPERKDAEGNMRFKTGAGSIIDAEGFILTAAHVLTPSERGYVVRHTGQPLTYRKFAVINAYDLAIVRIEPSDDYPVLPLGRSDDLMLGEPVVAVGNPRSYGLTVTEGIVSGLNRFSLSGEASMRDMIQTSAPLNPGNSGGPLINAAGRQIGIALRGNDHAESLGLAVAADRIRHLLPRLIAAGPRFGIDLGIVLDPLADPPTVAELAEDGPAAEADLHVGDELLSLDGQSLTFAHAMHLSVVDKEPGQVIELGVRRGDSTHSIALTLGEHRAPQPVAESTPMRPGLQYTTFELEQNVGVGTLDAAFEAGEVATRGVINRLSLEAVRPRREYYAVRYEGYLKVPGDGVYALSLTSDDGSRLYLDDRLLIENDGDHPALTEANVVRLREGAYPIRLEYFQGRGASGLSLAWERDFGPLERVPDSAFARDAEPR